MHLNNESIYEKWRLASPNTKKIVKYFIIDSPCNKNEENDLFFSEKTSNDICDIIDDLPLSTQSMLNYYGIYSIENKEMKNTKMENTKMENKEMENTKMENKEMENTKMENKEMENTKMENTKMENKEMENKNNC